MAYSTNSDWLRGCRDRCDAIGPVAFTLGSGLEYLSEVF